MTNASEPAADLLASSPDDVDHCPNCGTLGDCDCAASCDLCHEVVDALAWVVSADGYDRYSLCAACTVALRTREAEERAEDRAADPHGIADDGEVAA